MEHLPLQITVNRTRNTKRNAKDHCTFWYLSFIYWPCTVNVMKHSVQCPYLYYIKMILKSLTMGGRNNWGKQTPKFDSVWEQNLILFFHKLGICIIKTSSVLQILFNKKNKNANYWNEQVNSIFHSFEGLHANSREKSTKITSRAQLTWSHVLLQNSFDIIFFTCHGKSV